MSRSYISVNSFKKMNQALQLTLNDIVYIEVTLPDKMASKIYQTNVLYAKLKSNLFEYEYRIMKME